MDEETINKFQTLKKKVERLQRESDRASGALAQAEIQLKENFGCKTLKEAETKLRELEKQEDKAKENYEKAVSKFEGDWENELK